MDTFDDFLGKAKTFVDIAGRKTGEAVEVARLKMSRMQINAEIQKTYEKLGAFVYKFEKTGEKNDDLIAICVGEIDDLLSQLRAIAEKINEIKSTIKCPECGAVNDYEAFYCTKCGARMGTEASTEEAPEEPEDDITQE